MRLLALTFISSFILGCSNLNSESNYQKEHITVALQPLNTFPSAFQDTLKLAIENFYEFKVVKLPNVLIPKKYFINIKSPRYRADSIINYLRISKPDSIKYIVGLTNLDISTTKKDKSGNIKKPEHTYYDWGIFGLGYRPGSSCVISTYRLKSNKNKFVERLKKVTMHELGHNLGLPHCPNKHCFMQDAAETIKTIDGVELNLCEECRDQL